MDTYDDDNSIDLEAGRYLVQTRTLERLEEDKDLDNAQQIDGDGNPVTWLTDRVDFEVRDCIDTRPPSRRFAQENYGFGPSGEDGLWTDEHGNIWHRPKRTY